VLLVANVVVRLRNSTTEARGTVVARKLTGPEFREPGGGQRNVAPPGAGLTVVIFVVDLCLKPSSAVEINLGHRLVGSVEVQIAVAYRQTETLSVLLVHMPADRVAGGMPVAKQVTQPAVLFENRIGEVLDWKLAAEDRD
jgi:hypothetical protein